MWKREKFCKTLRVLFCGKAVLFVFGGEERGGGGGMKAMQKCIS